MKLKKLVPDFLKPVLKPIYNALFSSKDSKKNVQHKSRNEIHQYWKDPSDDMNPPEGYVDAKERSLFLIDIVKRYVSQDARIIEIGCNVGRNLNYLFQNGFKNLEAIEISEKAVQLLKKTFPDMAQHIEVYNMPVEEKIKTFEKDRFDVVFTMAVLEHIHSESEWVFQEMVKMTKEYLITIEDEHHLSWRHFPRNYKSIFEPLGMKQVEEINCKEIKGLGSHFQARIFKKIH